MECGSDRETGHRAEFKWFREDRHHGSGGFVCTHSVVHEVAGGEVHEVVIREEDGHVVGGDAQARSICVGVCHADEEAKLRLYKLIEFITREHVVAKFDYRGESNEQTQSNGKIIPCKPLVRLAGNLTFIGMGP